MKSTAWLTVLSPATRFAFHGEAKARTAVQAAWGVEFSEQACRAHADARRATLWLGPDEYLLLDFGSSAPSASPSAPGDSPSVPGGSTSAPDGTPSAPGVLPSAAGALAASLEGALTGIPHALVDVSHRQFALAVSGPHAADILNGACPLDLDLVEFPVGMCTRTVFAKADIVLWRTAPDTFHVEVWRSFAGYVTGILAEIASEFYPGG